MPWERKERTGSIMSRSLRCAIAITAGTLCFAQTRTVSVQAGFGKSGPPLHIEAIALGQGGLSADPIWDSRLAEVRALRPKIIRLFVQEYFSLMPGPGKYHFESLDRSVDLIRAAHAIPVLALAFKPAVLYPN